MRHTYSLTPSFRRALLITLAYVIPCILYIVVSGRIAARLAGSAMTLQRIELIKGIAFVIITGLLFFSFAFLHLRRIATRERLIAEQRLLIAEAQRRALAGSFAASIGHDINNILGIIDFGAFRLQEHAELTEDGRKTVQSIADGAEKIQTLVQRLMAIARKNVRSGVEEFDLAELAANAVELTRKHIRLRHCDLQLESDGQLLVLSNPHIIEQVLINIILNAADATCAARHGSILVRLMAEEKQGRIEIHDSGPGIAGEERDRIFDFFHSTKENGAGLGLAGAKTSIEMINGTLAVDRSAELGGALFTVAIPKQYIAKADEIQHSP